MNERIKLTEGIRKIVDEATREHLTPLADDTPFDIKQANYRLKYFEMLKGIFHDDSELSALYEAIAAFLGNMYVIDLLDGDCESAGIQLNEYLQNDNKAVLAFKDIIKHYEERQQRMIVKESIAEREEDLEEAEGEK